jgi:hypothetical protein
VKFGWKAKAVAGRLCEHHLRAVLCSSGGSLRLLLGQPRQVPARRSVCGRLPRFPYLILGLSKGEDLLWAVSLPSPPKSFALDAVLARGILGISLRRSSPRRTLYDLGHQRASGCHLLWHLLEAQWAEESPLTL